MDKNINFFLITLLTLNLFSQEASEDQPKRSDLIDEAINLEAISSSNAASRQDSIDELDSQIIFLPGRFNIFLNS